jgi:hypothetical protein
VLVCVVCCAVLAHLEQGLDGKLDRFIIAHAILIVLLQELSHRLGVTAGSVGLHNANEQTNQQTKEPTA